MNQPIPRGVTVQPSSRPSTTMTARGIGSRSSPIVIDDDDDIAQPSPITVDSGSSSSRSVTPPQESLSMVKAQDPIPAKPEESNRLKNNIGYSILVRMGYKPGQGLGVNLEGVTSPVKACTRFQKFPAGLGASNAWGGSSKIAQRIEENGTTTIEPRSIPTTTKPVHETTTSIPKDNIKLLRSSEATPAPLPRSASSKPPPVSSKVGPALRRRSTPVHDNACRSILP
ncbi:hypothetical protein EI94DRAFT_774029 [Lactarius quietus]|nr:hypothetical protein EI94DRAFT_774029 [Lactarius quietus]